MTAEQKMAETWGKIMQDTRPAKYVNPAKLFAGSSDVVFTNMRDTMVAGRSKTIHGVGVVWQFELDIPPLSPFTGLLASGKLAGIIRLGSALPVMPGFGMVPGIGLKIFRSGVHSANTVLLDTLELNTGLFNFFRANMSNHLTSDYSQAAVVGLALKFSQASVCAVQVGLSDFTRWTQSGEYVEDPIFPFKLLLVPTQAVQTPDYEKTLEMVNAEMMSFPVGTPLYEAYACGSPSGAEELDPSSSLDACGAPFRLGFIRTTSPGTTSKYGDEKMFIRHQRIEDDWALRPDWLEEYDHVKACMTMFDTFDVAYPAASSCPVGSYYDNWDVPTNDIPPGRA